MVRFRKVVSFNNGNIISLTLLAAFLLFFTNPANTINTSGQTVRVPISNSNNFTKNEKSRVYRVLSFLYKRDPNKEDPVEQLSNFLKKDHSPFREEILKHISSQKDAKELAVDIKSLVQTFRSANIYPYWIIRAILSLSNAKEVAIAIDSFSRILINRGVYGNDHQLIIEGLIEWDLDLTRGQVPIETNILKKVEGLRQQVRYLSPTIRAIKKLPSSHRKYIHDNLLLQIGHDDIEKVYRRCCNPIIKLLRTRKERKDRNNEVKRLKFNGEFLGTVVNVGNEGSGVIVDCIDGWYIIFTCSHVSYGQHGMVIRTNEDEPKAIGVAVRVLENKYIPPSLAKNACQNNDIAIMALKLKEDKDYSVEPKPIKIAVKTDGVQIGTLVSGCNDTISSGVVFAVGNRLLLSGAQSWTKDSGSPVICKTKAGDFVVRGIIATVGPLAIRFGHEIFKKMISTLYGSRTEFELVSSDEAAREAVKMFLEKQIAQIESENGISSDLSVDLPNNRFCQECL